MSAVHWDPDRVPLARPGARFFGFAIDAIILAMVGIFGLIGFVGVEQLSEADPIPRSALLILDVMSGVYLVSLTALRGQTLGKMVVRTKVVDVDTGVIPSWSQAFIRWGLPAAIGAIPVIGFATLIVYAWLLWDDRLQGLHDKAARTLVIDIDRLAG